MSDIIERLDTALEAPPDERNTLCKECECGLWHVSVSAAYPELRAELLRLQEERDARHRDGSEEYRLRMEMKKQRDALLEALKGVITDIESVGADVSPSLVHDARTAIANVEGRE